MFITRSRRVAAATIASLALVGLAACGGSDSDEPADDKKSSAAAPAPEPTEETSAAPAASGNQPAWAKPALEGGEKISTVKAGDITVDIYQVGTTKATRTGQFVDPDTNKPLLDKGDDIVFVNYVITNNGQPVDLGSSLVSVEPRYKDWKYLQGMDAVVDDALFEQQKVNKEGIVTGAYNEKGIYPFGAGESYTYGENFKYQKNSPITFKVTITPVDAEGELVHDKRVEGEGDGTIK
ncbi:hypothetical protein [Aeromicrobium chenweiae]|uniref:Uncharacterized protein n=1 Tax=Aeromicrobium chenweiae TaxID=2079793 RepID=A0A2S0WME8_9ACTN|nr:hypothetical protein [Aeromicrobium chenweiae]AWB92434.1 hypothetical protein C3E78_09595 [Aeromicrobium chenweiae]TGN31277.1 hypothetical protein E4L97_12975 [Aeromicrobium chenweiae]